MPQTKTTFMGDFRRFFGRGLAVLLPSVLTLWLLWYAFVFVFNSVAVPINTGLRQIVLHGTPYVLPEKMLPDWYVVTDDELKQYKQSPEGAPRANLPEKALRMEVRRSSLAAFWESHWYLKLAGLVVAITAIYLAGLLLGGLIGRKLYTLVERVFSRVPGFKQVYPHVKQLVDLVMGDRQMAFSKVVIIEFPRGSWALGFITGAALKQIQVTAGVECVTVFIPHTPIPFTGFAVSVPKDSCIEVPITIDEAIRFLLTGGVLVPESQAVVPLPPAAAELARQMAASGAKASGPA